MKSKMAGSLVVGALSIGLLAIGGCDQSDPAAEAIDSVSRQLQALHGGQGVLAPAPRRAEVYDAAVLELRPHLDVSEPYRQAAARRLLSTVQAAQASLGMEGVGSLQEEALLTMSHARAIYETYRSAHALAEAARVYDPSEDLAELRSELSNREDLLDATRAEREAVAAQIEALEQQRQDRLAEARELRAEEQEVRERIAELSGQERLTLVRKATTVQRRADAKEVEAATLQARIERQRPDLSAIDDEIGRLEKQRELLLAAIQRVQERVQDNQETAQRAEERADQSTQKLRAVMNELTELMTGSLAEARSQVLSAQRESVRTAQPMSRLSSVERGDAAIKMATLQQDLADIERSRALDWELLRGLNRQLTRAQPPLPDAEIYEQGAADAEARRIEALRAAAEAYAAARREYEAVAGRGEIGERVDALLASLAELERSVAAQLPDAAADGAVGDG